MSLFGNALIVAGIAVLLVVLYLGYSFYNSVSSMQFTTSVATTSDSSSVASAVNTLVNGLLSNTNSYFIVIIKIILLFLFASIGYKFAILGINENKAVAEAIAEASEQKEDEKGTSAKIKY